MGEKKYRARRSRVRAPGPVVHRIRAIRDTLVELTLGEADPIELIPFQDHAFALVGSPPDAFRLIWVTPKGFTYLDKAVARGQLGADTLVSLHDRLRSAYEQTPWDVRYLTDVGDRSILVTVSAPLEQVAREAAPSLPS